MRATSIIAPVLAIVSVANAKIYGIAAPRTVAVGSTVKLKIIAEDYIQSIQDVAIAFGIQPASHAVPDALGTLLGEKYLGPGKLSMASASVDAAKCLSDNSNIVGNISTLVQIPSGTPKGKTTLTGSLFSLIGALLSPNTEDFTVNITVGHTTSPDYVSSIGN